VSGFVKPSSPNRLFIWQVAVAESERGKGFASKMLHHLLKRNSCEGIEYIETTISPSNIASQKLFHGLARDLKIDIKVSECFRMKNFNDCFRSAKEYESF